MTGKPCSGKMKHPIYKISKIPKKRTNASATYAGRRRGGAGQIVRGSLTFFKREGRGPTEQHLNGGKIAQLLKSCDATKLERSEPDVMMMSTQLPNRCPKVNESAKPNAMSALLLNPLANVDQGGQDSMSTHSVVQMKLPAREGSYASASPHALADMVKQLFDWPLLTRGNRAFVDDCDRFTKIGIDQVRFREQIKQIDDVELVRLAVEPNDLACLLLEKKHFVDHLAVLRGSGTPLTLRTRAWGQHRRRYGGMVDESREYVHLLLSDDTVFGGTICMAPRQVIEVPLLPMRYDDQQIRFIVFNDDGYHPPVYEIDEHELLAQCRTATGRDVMNLLHHAFQNSNVASDIVEQYLFGHIVANFGENN